MAHSFHDLEPLVVAIASIFEKKLIKYVLIGGVAVGQLTRPRFTKDVDFLVDVPQLKLPAVLEAMNEIGGDVDVISAIKAWNTNHMLVYQVNSIRVDWLKPVIPVYAHIIDHGVTEKIDGTPLKIASPEGLIVLKLLAYRPQDQLDIESLIATKRDSLDLNWINAEWQTIGELNDPAMLWFQERYQHILSGGR